MLVIRNTQLHLLGRIPQDVFKVKVVEHLHTFFPDDARRLGEAGLGRFVDLGIDRGLHHGLQTQGEFCRFINLMAMLGSGFDEDPQIPWAAEILGGVRAHDAERMTRLYATALDFIRKIRGDDGQPFLVALAQVCELSSASLQPHDVTAPDSLPSLLSLYPHKYLALSPDRIDAMATLGRGQASRHGLGGRFGENVCSILMFLLGSHFDRDPFYPWASVVLAAEAPDPLAKAALVFHTAIAQARLALRAAHAKGA